LVTVMTNCKDCRSHLPDLLLDDAYITTHPEFKEHLAACNACRTELAELRSTFALLGEWKAPEVSPYFDSRLHARLREAAAAPPEGLWERTRSFLLFSTGRQFRPALAGALAFVMLIGGGGTFANFYHAANSMPPVADSATVNDLKIMDNNIQAEQQMNQLLDDSTPSADSGAAVPTT
jgi:anti-sigma factor RsiW